jgi:choline-sulfatase
MFPSDVGSWCNATVIKQGVPTWGSRLHDAGYYCFATGKMDLAGKGTTGFDEVDTKHSHATSPDITSFFRRPTCFRPDNRDRVEGVLDDRPHGDERVLRQALSFLHDRVPKLSQPWAMWVGFTAPLPYFVVGKRYYDMYQESNIPMPEIPDGYLDKLPPPWEVTRTYKCIATPIAEERIRRARRAYYALVTSLDERIGLLLADLKRLGLEDDTIVVYTTDHGQSVGEHGLWFHNEPTDCSSRVPLILAGPGIPTGKCVDAPVMHVDLFPTFMDLAGAAVPAGLRGSSLMPLIEGRASDRPDFAYSECHAEATASGSFVIRRGPWKYIHYSYYDDLLFNLEEDPGEYRDVIRSREGQRVAADLYGVLRTLVNPDERTEAAFARQEEMLLDMCRRMTLEELLVGGFEQRLGRAQATSLLRKYKKA